MHMEHFSQNFEDLEADEMIILTQILEKIGYKGGIWLQLPHNVVEWWALGNTAMGLQVLRGRKFLGQLYYHKYLRETVHGGVSQLVASDVDGQRHPFHTPEKRVTYSVNCELGQTAEHCQHYTNSKAGVGFWAH